MAARANRQPIVDGRMVLICGSVEQLSEIDDTALDTPFDHIFGVNVTMFWKDPPRVFEALRRRLGDGGQLAFTFQPRVGDLSDNAALSAAERIIEDLRKAGFEDIRLERLASLSPMAVCVMARR